PCVAGAAFNGGPANIYQNFVRGVANFVNVNVSRTLNIHDNDAVQIYADFDNATHGNYIQDNSAAGGCYIYNNYASLLGVGWAFPLNIHVGSNSSCYVFNNVYSNIGSTIG